MASQTPPGQGRGDGGRKPPRDPLRCEPEASPDLSFDFHSPAFGTHALHPYAARFPPALARWAIERYTAPGDRLLDPFAGSGTALVEARLMRRHALGSEIDPLAALISRVKATPLEPAAVSAARAAIDQAWLPCALRNGTIACGVALPDTPNRDYWFHPAVQHDLAHLRDAIGAVHDRAVREFLLVVYSSIIVAKGPSTVANALDIAHSRAHHIERPSPPDVRARFADRLARALRGLAAFSAAAPRNVHTVMLTADARALPYRSRTIDLVLTSPPYVTAIEYPRAHKFSIWWIGQLLGVSNRLYESLRERYIGTENVRRTERVLLRGRPTGLATVDRVAAELDAVSETRGGRARRYFKDMRAALGEMLRVLRPRGTAVLVVGDSLLRGVNLPTAACLAEIAESLNDAGDRFALRETYLRTIREQSRQLPIKRGRNGEGMRIERVLVFERRPATRPFPAPVRPDATAAERPAAGGSVGQA